MAKVVQAKTIGIKAAADENGAFLTERTLQFARKQMSALGLGELRVLDLIWRKADHRTEVT